MNEEKDSAVGTVLMVAGAIVLAPVIIDVGVKIISATVGLIYGLTTGTIEAIKNRRKIKKGLKNGSIVEVDGAYYEVEEA